jgi:hypothetical protein
VRRTASGASVYTLSERASDEVAAQLAAKENRADALAGIDLSEEANEVAPFEKWLANDMQGLSDRPEGVFVPGDADGPMFLYEWTGTGWTKWLRPSPQPPRGSPSIQSWPGRRRQPRCAVAYTSWWFAGHGEYY